MHCGPHDYHCNTVALVFLSRLVDLVVKQYVCLFFMRVSFSPDVLYVCCPNVLVLLLLHCERALQSASWYLMPFHVQVETWMHSWIRGFRILFPNWRCLLWFWCAFSVLVIKMMQIISCRFTWSVCFVSAFWHLWRSLLIGCVTLLHIVQSFWFLLCVALTFKMSLCQ